MLSKILITYKTIFFATLLRFVIFTFLMNSKLKWDALGISASIACAIHCAVLPLLISSLPIFSINIIDNIAFEYFMIFLAFAIGSFSLLHGYRKHHKSYLPIFLFTIGMLLLLAKQAWHEYQYWLLPFAIIFIVTAHIRNIRLCRIYDHLNSKRPTGQL